MENQMNLEQVVNSEAPSIKHQSIELKGSVQKSLIPDQLESISEKIELLRKTQQRLHFMVKEVGQKVKSLK